MRTIVTVTLNPAIDRTVWLDGGLVPGTTHRTADTRARIGGKGINVARTAARLGAPVVALGISGEEQAAGIERHLHAAGIEPRFRATAGETRTNLKIIERPDGRMTEINGSGPEVDARLIEQVEGDLLDVATRKRAAVVVLAGSLPLGVSPDVYARWVARLRDALGAAETGGPAVLVDASDAALECAVDARPFAIKPNRVEAEALLGRPIDSDEHAEQAARALVRRGPLGVLLSLGSRGAIAAWDGAAERIPARPLASFPGRLVTTVGAGDAMVARLAVDLAARDGAPVPTTAEFISMCRHAVDEAAGQISAGE